MVGCVGLLGCWGAGWWVVLIVGGHYNKNNSNGRGAGKGVPKRGNPAMRDQSCYTLMRTVRKKHYFILGEKEILDQEDKQNGRNQLHYSE